MFAYQIRHAFRRLVREPGFTAAAVLTLALGVGANVAVFAVVEAVLLRPLPYPAADELVTLRHRDDGSGITKEFIAIGDYVDLAAGQSAFQGVGSYGSGRVTISGDGDPYQVAALFAGPGLLDLLGVRAAVGRSFTAEDGVTGAGQIAMLGYDLWRTRFGSDPAIVGRSIRIGSSERTVVGVAPEGLQFPPGTDAAVILNQTTPAQPPANRKSGWTFGLARLKPGATLALANTDLANISRRMAGEFPEQNQGSTYYAESLRDSTVGSTRTPLVLLLAAVGVVLLIACANVANLLLARALSRRRELAVRMTLGAGRARLVGQMLSESFALALVSGAVGLVFARLGARALVRLVPAATAPPGLADVGINGPVLAFALGMVLLTALVCGLVAALSTPLDNAAGALVGAGKSSMTKTARRATSTLVVAEIALAVVLLVGAGLILKSFAGLVSVDPGFRTDHILTVNLSVPADRYREGEAREAFWSSAYTAIRAAAGVEDVGQAAVIPLTGNNWTIGFERTDQPVPPGERPPEVGWQAASGGYFSTLRIPLKSGRYFDATDRPGTPAVVIASEAIEARFFPGQSAVGRHIRLGEQTAEIVGVVGNIRRAGLRDEPRADLYFPAERNPGVEGNIFVRASGTPAAVTASIRAALREIEPDVVLREPRALSSIAAESVQDTRLVLWLLGVFAVTALALAAVGIYGVMAYVVRQRTREIGTRMALGAGRPAILWMVMRQGATIAATGTAVGLIIALAATGALRSLLYGVSSFDPAVVAAALLVLMATSLLACWIPARRATRVDPARTLQEP